MKDKKRFATFFLTGALLLAGLSACGGGTSSATTSEGEVISTSLQSKYETGVVIDLTPTVAAGWSYQIAIYQGNTPLVSKLDGTSYTFNQSGEYTIIYTATKGNEKKTLSVKITVTAAIGETFVTFEGTKYNLACYAGFVAKLLDKSTNEPLVETTYSYTRSTDLGKSGYTNAEGAVGPVFYIHYADKTETNGMPATARSSCTGDAMSLAYDDGKYSDTFTLSKEKYQARFNGSAKLTMSGKDSVFGASSLVLYSDGLCSYSFLGGEVTAGRLEHDGAYVVYGGGTAGNSYGGGIWSYTGTTGDDFQMDLNIDGTHYDVTKTVTNELQFTYTYSISAYKRVMSMSSPASSWMPSLLGLAAQKVAFNGSTSTLICYDDAEQSVGVYKNSDLKTAIQTGSWSFNSISRKFSITLKNSDGSTSDLPVNTDGERLNVVYSNASAGITNDTLETSLSWAQVFPEAGKKLIDAKGTFAATVDGTAISGKTVNLSLYGNATFMVTGSLLKENDLVDTGSYTFNDNVFTFTGEHKETFTSRFAKGTYSLDYLVHIGASSTGYSCTLSFSPELTMSGVGGTTGSDTTFVLNAFQATDYGANYATLYGNNAKGIRTHVDTATYVKNNDGSYTFTFARFGTVTTTGSGDSLSLVYPYTSGGKDYPVTLVIPAAQ